MDYILRLYQTEASEKAIEFFQSKKKRNAIMVLPTGSGKSLIIADIASKLNDHVLIFQPSKEILEQNFAKLQSYGVLDCSIFSASFNSKEISRITFAMIGSVRNKPEFFAHFKYVIVDECFPAGSLVDGIPIERLSVGDYIDSFNHSLNVVEKKKIVRVFKNEKKSDLLKITLSDNTIIICTENHPIFINKLGYIPAKYLSLHINKMLNDTKNGKNNRSLFELWKGILSQKVWEKCILQYRLFKEKRINTMFGLWNHVFFFNEILLAGMCAASNNEQSKKGNNQLSFVWKGNYNYGLSTHKLQQNRKGVLLRWMWSFSQNNSTYRNAIFNQAVRGTAKGIIRENEVKKSNVDGWSKRKNDRIIKGENFSKQGWQRKTNQTTDSITFRNRVSNGISNKYSRCKTFISISSKLLQSRFGIPRKENCNRSRWENPPLEKMEVLRQTENGDIKFIGVESVEIYESGSRSEFKSVCGDNYVYNIEVEDNHNYFVSGTLVHNCHLVNSKNEDSMYNQFLSNLDCRVLGLTATPYRLSFDGFGGSILKFLTRTRPRIFSELIYHVQIKELADEGFLAKMEYYQINIVDPSKLVVNSTGADFTDKSVQKHYKDIEFNLKLKEIIERLIKSGRKNILVFTRFVAEAQELSDHFNGLAEMVSGETPKKERERILNDFKSGQIRIVTNVGVLTTGFDFPELATIVLARPTMSLALYYQMIGRAMRPHESKSSAWIVDLCQTYKRFGRVESLELKAEKPGIWAIFSGNKQLTNSYYGDR